MLQWLLSAPHWRGAGPALPCPGAINRLLIVCSWGQGHAQPFLTKGAGWSRVLVLLVLLLGCVGLHAHALCGCLESCSALLLEEGHSAAVGEPAGTYISLPLPGRGAHPGAWPWPPWHRVCGSRQDFSVLLGGLWLFSIFFFFINMGSVFLLDIRSEAVTPQLLLGTTGLVALYVATMLLPPAPPCGAPWGGVGGPWVGLQLCPGGPPAPAEHGRVEAAAFGVFNRFS